MKNFVWFVLILFAFSALSCQDESGSISQDTSNNFGKTSPISSLIKRVSQYETTGDNVLDGTSNCSIKLPVHVTVNNHYIYIANSGDFQEVEDAKNNYPGDDVVHFDFSSPLTIIYPNYEEYVVSSQSQLDYIFSYYGDDSPYREIKCIDFKYTSPIKINLYNTDNQVASTVNIISNQQFYNFLDNLSSTQIVGINYPIKMQKTTGEEITINNNSEMEDAINAAVTDCSTTNTTPLTDIISSGSWHVSYFYENNTDQTYHYSGYNFTFNAGGSMLAVKNSINTQGIWSITSNYLTIHFENEDQYLHELEQNWQVQQDYTATYVRLKHEEGGGECYYLDFTKN